ncbi:MAG: type III pantothenate kinase [Oscillospiraceae bacterium]|nr:type III pantothenate kinase [Oscillospiraceae bacterium]
MLLVIDVGNTNTVFGLYKERELVGTFRIRTEGSQTSDEIGMKILQYYNIRGFHPTDTKAVLIASVVPPAMYSLTNAIRKYFNLHPVVIGKDIDPGILNLYINPREVGIDRLVNAVSAIEKYGKPLIIVDIGTATTFDCIDEHGAYLGGAIFPGIKIAMEALFMKASKLPRVDITRPEMAIGRSTVQSMQSGAVRGYVGALTGIITDMKKEMAPGVKVIATGGMGRMMAEYCPLIDEVDSNLTLDAMQMIYERNKEVFANRTFDGNAVVEATEETN